MSETYNVYEAKTHLSHLLERVAKGEQIIIAKAGKPLGKLVPLDYAPQGFSERFSEQGGQAAFTHQGLPLSVDHIKKKLAADEFLVTRGGKPFEIMKLTGKRHPERKPGQLKGKVWIAPDAFSKELDEKIAAEFYASEIFPPEE